MLGSDMTIGGWAHIDDGCPIEVRAGDDGVEVAFGMRPGRFEMVFSVEALARLAEQAGVALARARGISS
ncbi:hypothetical protein ACOBQX_13195 [Actinokineospora sp. G85]|uniref:hypothetical protein n=1 Tax=Actinokineospora sp. G85 TaxID=3406626 RepID=UPI003C736FEF